MTTDNQMAAREGDLVMLGCKPDDLGTIAAEINGGIKDDALVISILAAMPTKTISNALGHSKICRCMPNTPVKIQQGVIPYYVTPTVPEEQKDLVDELFIALGYPMYLGKEAHLDVIVPLYVGCNSYINNHYRFLQLLVDHLLHISF